MTPPPIEPDYSSPPSRKPIHPARIVLLVLFALLVGAVYAGTIFVLTFERTISPIQVFMLLLPLGLVIVTIMLKLKFNWSGIVAAHVCLLAILLLLVGVCASGV